MTKATADESMIDNYSNTCVFTDPTLAIADFSIDNFVKLGVLPVLIADNRGTLDNSRVFKVTEAMDKKFKKGKSLI